jgi:hypothetical protein
MVTVVAVTKATEYQSVSHSQSHYFWFIFVGFWIQTLDWRPPILTTGYCGFNPSLKQMSELSFYNWFVPYPYYLLILWSYIYASFVVHTKWNPVAPPIQYFYRIIK